MEREFLIRVAPIYLACRFRVMGGRLIGKWPKSDLALDLLGMVDYAAEMRLVCGEAKEDEGSDVDKSSAVQNLLCL